jgi:hypothetical protein
LISAVVFDFYFTLADPTIHAEAAIAEMLERHGSTLGIRGVATSRARASGAV